MTTHTDAKAAKQDKNAQQAKAAKGKARAGKTDAPSCRRCRHQRQGAG